MLDTIKDSDKGLRFNEGKTRFDLMEPFALEQLAKVFTKGAQKYEEHNWLRGMKWSKMLASLKRHIAAFEKGEDFDSETGLHHVAHAAWNAMGLVSYYKYFPQGDDRRHKYLTEPKIGLDIDEVLADWVTPYKEKYGYKDNHEFQSWYVHYDIIRQCTEDLDNDWYYNLKPKIKPEELPFEPHCYITSRHESRHEITKCWLHDNGFPCVPVYTVSLGKSKVDIARESGIDIFVDDVYRNFIELNKAGICTFLLDAPHNQRFDVGYKRLYSLKDLA